MTKIKSRHLARVAISRDASTRVPGSGGRVPRARTIANGTHWEEVRPDNVITIDMDGNTVEGGGQVERAHALLTEVGEWHTAAFAERRRYARGGLQQHWRHVEQTTHEVVAAFGRCR